jgi:hypothetical protein
MYRRPLLILFLALAFVSCKGGPTEPSDVAARANVAGRITHKTSGTPFAGASVVIGDARATTDDSGQYTLAITRGEHDVIVADEAVGVLRAQGGGTYRGDYAVEPGACTRYYGLVLDAQTDRPLAGATVRLAETAITDANGSYVLYPRCTDRGSGTTFMTASMAGYADARRAMRAENLPPSQRFDFRLTRE